jgi:L-aminopeptidase/D-esterase-like protein
LKADWRGNTTLVVIATDAPLTSEQCSILSRMGAAGLARTIYPAFTPFDGDVLFAVSTGNTGSVDTATTAYLGTLGADSVARSIARAVRAAQVDARPFAYRS